ncbi:hypothetical protein Fmac_029460 [Flemingia macrophylla]|uniref:Uncharacterized protein n=1 Tax=Flemingia macrophylla TaxID=520843 RepID=A0ABD1LAI1_9FABA
MQNTKQVSGQGSARETILVIFCFLGHSLLSYGNNAIIRWNLKYLCFKDVEIYFIFKVD